jgi:hypothetical protein
MAEPGPAGTCSAALPLNTHGGQLSAGRTHGFGFLAEAMSQLRGDAAERQVADAQVAVVTTGGGTPGGALLCDAMTDAASRPVGVSTAVRCS